MNNKLSKVRNFFKSSNNQKMSRDGLTLIKIDDVTY